MFMSLSTVTNNNRNWNSNKSLKVQLLLKKLFILAVINGIHVRYGECSWVYLFDVDDFSVTCVNYQAIWCRILNVGFCDPVERIFVAWIAHGLLITNLLDMCRWNFPSLHSHFSKPAMRTMYRSKWLDQGDWKTDLLSLDPFWPERPAEQSPQNLKKKLFVWRNYVLTWTLQLRNSDEDHCFCNTLLRMSAIKGR